MGMTDSKERERLLEQQETSKIAIATLVSCWLCFVFIVNDIALLAVVTIFLALCVYGLYRANFSTEAIAKTQVNVTDEHSVQKEQILITLINDYKHKALTPEQAQELIAAFTERYWSQYAPCDAKVIVGDHILEKMWQATDMVASPHYRVFHVLTSVLIRLYDKAGEGEVYGQSPRGDIVKGLLLTHELLAKAALNTSITIYMEQCYTTLELFCETSAPSFDDPYGNAMGVVRHYEQGLLYFWQVAAEYMDDLDAKA